jgi:DNA polymerase-1
MKLLVLDGNSIVNRAFYGIRLLTTKGGLYTNGIYGFLTILNKLNNETEPDAVAIAFDMRAPTFRHKEYAGYKAQRKGMPEELAQQLPNLKQLLTYLGYRIVECEGFEADDILGTLAHRCKETGDECILATGDRDSLQLVAPNVSVRLATTRMGQTQVTVYDEAKVKEDYGVTPLQLIEIKAIQGDASDNIPGVRGIGVKGAGDLIQRFNNLDYIYENIDTIDIKENMRKKLIENKETAYLSRYLGTIRTDAPIDTDISSYIPKPRDNASAARLMAKLEFFSLMDKFGINSQAADKTGEIEESSVVMAESTDKALLLEKLQKSGRVDFIASWEKDNLKLYINFENKIHTVDDLDFIKNILEDKKIKKNTHDVKPLYSVLMGKGITLNNVTMDTMLAAYLLNPSASGYEPSRLSQEYGVPFTQSDDENASAAGAITGLTDTFSEKIAEKGQTELLNNIELPLAKVLANMENVGFEVDPQGIKGYGETLQKQIEKIQLQIYEMVGYEFNINSPKQLGSALFEKLGLKHGKKTKTGYSTAASVLENLRYEHPAVELVLEYRSLAKLKSTYCDGLLKVIGSDGRIHSSFNQTETRTGRISSTEPNLQNIPVRTELGRELRRFFTAKEGWVLVDADYSQIELRVLAHVANDKNMIQAFLNNDDIHRSTASQVFHMPEQMVTPVMRSRAKAVNFGIVYGIGAFSLAKDIKVSRKEAETYINDYLSHYSGIDEYMKRVVEEAKDNGYAETMFGRRRYLPELTSKNFNTRSFGERVARNMPIQGAAADIIKIAMIRVENRLMEENMKSRLILQVHDELIVESPKDEAEKARDILTEEMQNAAKLSVPLIAQASIGKDWYEAKA